MTTIDDRIKSGAAAADAALDKRMEIANVVLAIQAGLLEEFDGVDSTTREGRKIKNEIASFFEDIADRLGITDAMAVEISTPAPKATTTTAAVTPRAAAPAVAPAPAKATPKGGLFSGPLFKKRT